MERLTKWENENAVLSDYDYEEMKDKFYKDNDSVDCVNLEFALEKLAEYEDAEEQGLLFRLPSKEVYLSNGDTVYYIFDYEIVECINCGVSMDCEGKLWIALACDEDIFPYREPIAEIDTDPTDWCMNTTAVMIDEWGKTVFHTKEEAFQVLAEMKGEN